jgi:hypothetical protein
MSPMDNLPSDEKQRALKLLTSVTIAPGSNTGAQAGWFLITPPQEANGHYDASAPLSKWKIEEGAGSREKCQEVQAFLGSLAQKKGAPGDIEEIKAAQCVSMHDPRLEAN